MSEINVIALFYIVCPAATSARRLRGYFLSVLHSYCVRFYCSPIVERRMAMSMCFIAFVGVFECERWLLVVAFF